MSQDNKKLMDRYKELPEDVKDAIFSVDSAEIIQNIAKKNNLTIDKMSELADEIGLLMLGSTEPKDFISNISRRLGVNRNIAHDITAEVNDKIFSKIRESLKKIHNLKDEEEEEKTELYRPEVVKLEESPNALNRESLLKEIENEDPEITASSQVVVDTDGLNESRVNIKPVLKESAIEEKKELSLPPPTPAIIEDKEESVVVKEDLPKEEIKSDKGSIELKPQISRRPPEVSEHDGDRKLGPGEDRYPEGDPYREPVK